MDIVAGCFGHSMCLSLIKVFDETSNHISARRRRKQPEQHSGQLQNFYSGHGICIFQAAGERPFHRCLNVFTLAAGRLADPLVLLVAEQVQHLV